MLGTHRVRPLVPLMLESLLIETHPHLAYRLGSPTYQNYLEVVILVFFYLKGSLDFALHY